VLADFALHTASAALPWLLDSREVARLLGIGRTKAFELMVRQELPTVRIGRCVRVPAGGLAIWIASQTTAVGE
jgi:excisionase family DNA binding protein